MLKYKTIKENKVMKILGYIVQMLMKMLFIAYCAGIATFFITIFNADGVTHAIEIFKGFFL